MRIKYVTCQTCKGRGEFLGNECKACRGRGQIPVMIPDEETAATSENKQEGR